MNTLTNLHVKSLQYRYVYTCVHVYVLDLTFSCQTTSHLHVQPNNLSKLLSHCCFDPAWAISQSSKPTKQLGASARCLSKNPPSFCHWCWWTKHGKAISSCDYSDYSNSPISLLKSIILQGAGGVLIFFLFSGRHHKMKHSSLSLYIKHTWKMLWILRTPLQKPNISAWKHQGQLDPTKWPHSFLEYTLWITICKWILDISHIKRNTNKHTYIYNMYT